MSAITKTTIELTPAQKIAIARHTAQRQLETGETYSQSQFVRDAIEAALQATGATQPAKTGNKRTMLIEFDERIWKAIKNNDAATVSRNINAALYREMEAA